MRSFRGYRQFQFFQTQILIFNKKKGLIREYLLQFIKENASTFTDVGDSGDDEVGAYL